MSILNATAPSGGSGSGAINEKTVTITTTSSVPLVFNGFDSVPTYYLLVKGVEEVGGSAPSGAQSIEVFRTNAETPAIISGTQTSGSNPSMKIAYLEQSAPVVDTSNHTLTFNTNRSRGVYHLYYYM